MRELAICRNGGEGGLKKSVEERGEQEGIGGSKIWLGQGSAGQEGLEFTVAVEQAGMLCSLSSLERGRTLQSLGRSQLQTGPDTCTQGTLLSSPHTEVTQRRPPPPPPPLEPLPGWELEPQGLSPLLNVCPHSWLLSRHSTFRGHGAQAIRGALTQVTAMGWDVQLGLEPRLGRWTDGKVKELSGLAVTGPGIWLSSLSALSKLLQFNTSPVRSRASRLWWPPVCRESPAPPQKTPPPRIGGGRPFGKGALKGNRATHLQKLLSQMWAGKRQPCGSLKLSSLPCLEKRPAARWRGRRLAWVPGKRQF